MKDIKLGKLLFNKKSIILISICLFLNGITIGAYASIGGNINFIFLFVAIYAPYLFLYKRIKNNVIELK